MEIHVVEKVMRVNDEFAQKNRQRLKAAGVTTLNLMSAPGSGKTTLIERALVALRDDVRMAVLEGDPDTTLDAERIARLEIPVTQIQTAGGCHLEAHLIGRALDNFALEDLDLLFIENVGNLVCPVEFDLGEDLCVAVVSTTEGHDKPAKYPKLFRKADVVLLNKVDLLPYVDFDCDVFKGYLKRLNPDVLLLEVSCRTGEGLHGWYNWLREAVVKGGRAQDPDREGVIPAPG
jgi:hydrogenase nickel incorporation protein HypB